MRKWTIAFVAVTILVGGGWLFAKGLTRSVEASKCRVKLRNARYLSDLAEEYAKKYGHYPVGIGEDVFHSATVPEFVSGWSLGPGVRYYSDGKNYSIVIVPGDYSGGPVDELTCTMVELRDGEFVNWPRIFDADFREANETVDGQ